MAQPRALGEPADIEEITVTSPERQRSSPYALDVRDVEYLRRGDESLLARVYSPCGSGPIPLLVEVRGGVWTTGSRLNNEPIARLPSAPGGRVPGFTSGHPTGHRLGLAEREELNGHPSGLGALGTSSGGHQVLLLALQPERYADPDADEPDSPGVELDFAELCWPVVDPWARYEWARRAGRTNIVEAHDVYWGGPKPMRQANPQLILDRGESVRRPSLLVLQGSAEQNVPYGIPEKFVAEQSGRERP